MSKKILAKVLAGAMAVSMVAGTGMVAAAAEPETPATRTLWFGNHESGTWLSDYIKNNFDADAAKEVLAKLNEKVMAAIPEEVLQKLQEIIATVSQEGFAANLVQGLIADVVDQVYKCVEVTTSYTILKVDRIYNFLKGKVDETKAKIDAAVADINAKLDAVKQQLEAVKAAVDEELSKYRVEDNTLILTEGDFEYIVTASLERGLQASVCAYNGEETEIVIPAEANGIPVIKVALFSDAAVTKVSLPATIEAFSAISLYGVPTVEAIEVDEENPYFTSVDGVVFDKEGATVVAVPPVKEYSPEEGVTAIAPLAYYNNVATSITLPSTMTTLSKNALAGFTNLEEIEIMPGMETIEAYALTSCQNLKKITVPSSVTKIAPSAFPKMIDPELTFYCDSATSYAAKFAKKHNLKLVAPLAVTYSCSDLVLLGSSAKVTANASCGTGDYLYAFYYRRVGTESWNAIQGFKPNNSVSFQPAYVGDYDVCIKVKDSSGTIVKEYNTLSVVQTGNNFSTLSAEEVAVDETITINAKSLLKGCTFAMYCQEEGADKWTTLQDYDANKTLETSFDKAGTYSICVKAKSKLGFISKKYFTVTVTE